MEEKKDREKEEQLATSELENSRNNFFFTANILLPRGNRSKGFCRAQW